MTKSQRKRRALEPAFRRSPPVILLPSSDKMVRTGLSTLMGCFHLGRWKSLRVLDLRNCFLGDKGLKRLAGIIQAGGFSVASEELDFSIDSEEACSKKNKFRPAALRAFVQALNGRGGELRLRQLRLKGQEPG